MTFNGLGKKAGSWLSILALCSALAGAGYNYRSLVVAQEDIEKLKQSRPMSKADFDQAIDKLEKRLERIESILMRNNLRK